MRALKLFIAMPLVRKCFTDRWINYIWLKSSSEYRLAICSNANVCSDDAITSKITSPIAVNARRKPVRDFVTDAA